MELATELTAPNTTLSPVYTDMNELPDDEDEAGQDLQPLNDVVKDGLKSGHQLANDLQPMLSFENSDTGPDEEPVETGQPATGQTRDRFCWVCHKDRSQITCRQCPRSYHLKCIPQSNSTNNRNSSQAFDSWTCIECRDIAADEEDLQQFLSTPAEDDNTNASVQSTYGSKWRLAQLSVEEMSELFKFSLQTIRQTADPTFHKPVSHLVFPDYHQLVHCPMDLSTIEKNIKTNKYRSQTAFLADIKWIVHNCIIYNHSNHPLTTNAKYLCRVARNEMAEMEICPDCFKNFYTVTELSFAEPCRKPHQLVFARVKGYPLWPAKVVRLGKQNEVDCRFFGTHDRAWVAVDACMLVSEQHPGAKPNKTHKSKFEGAMRELSVHIERLNAKFPNKFKYSPQKTPFSPKEIFILDDDNELYNKMVDEMLAKDSSRVNNGVNNGDNKANDSAEERTSKCVVPGVFSLSSDKAMDELKPELTISPESSSLLNKNIKSNSQNKDDSNPRTARVGKRNVAEALRASKVQRTSSSGSVSQSLLSPPSQRSVQSMSNVSNSNNTTNSTPMSTTSGVKTGKALTTASANVTVNAQSPQQSLTIQSSLREELDRLRKQLSFDNAMHKEEVRELKHNQDLVLMEMRQSWVNERDKALNDERQKHDLEKKLMVAQFEGERKKLVAQVDEAKRKQWCAECLKEAQLFCCYDTWYCTYECQKQHWKSHVNVCQQIHKKS